MLRASSRLHTSTLLRDIGRKRLPHLGWVLIGGSAEVKYVGGPSMDLTSLLNTKHYDLGQPYFSGMPHFPTHPPFLYSLTKRHGDILYANGVSSAADAIALGTHVGTHIDALSHFSCNGVCHGARVVEHTYQHGMSELGVDTIGTIVRHGVLLDIARLEGVDVLPEDFEITADHLSRASHIEVAAGDIVLLRTGWAQFFSDARRYINNTVAPGPGIEGAKWLSSRKIFAAGSDTVVFEKTPSPAMSVHAHLLVESGIHIIEVLNLEELARDQIYEFVLVAAPMNISGATGAPIRPIAFPI
jgi:kynurenine formamidase